VRTLRAALRGSSSIRRLRQLSAVALVVFSVFALTACGEKSEPRGAHAPIYPVSARDASGKLVSLSSRPQKIAVAGGAPTRIVASFGLEATPVGTGAGEINQGLIRSLQPDLLLVGEDIGSLSIQKSRALGIPLYVVPDRSFGGIERALSDIGLLTGKPMRGRREREQLVDQRMQIKTAIAGLEPVRVFFNRGRFTTFSANSFTGKLIAEAGGSNVAGTDVQEGRFSFKRLRRLNPDVLVVSRSSKLTLKKLRRSPRLRSISAVRNKRLVRIDMDLVAPGPDAGIGLRDLAAALHPDAFR
jgi:iron complex transport system substrate-binding protein